MPAHQCACPPAAAGGRRAAMMASLLQSPAAGTAAATGLHAARLSQRQRLPLRRIAIGHQCDHDGRGASSSNRSQVLCAAAAYPSSYGSGSGRGSSSPGGGGSGSGSGGYYSGGGSGSSVAADSSYGGSDGYGAAAAPGGALTETARASLARATAALRRWGWLSFWSQLSLGVAGGAALLFSVAFTSSTGPKAALYLTVLSMLGGFLSTFWAYGYQRTAQRMQEFLDGAAVASTKKHDVLQSLANGAAISVAAMGAAVAALAALIGSLAAKAVANATVDAAAAAAAGYDPVVALDVFLMLAAVTALLHHFVALACNLWVLNVVGEGRGLKFQRQQHIRALKEQEARADEVLRRAGVGGSSGLQL